MASKGNDSFSESQLINKIYRLTFESAVYNNECKEWMYLPETTKKLELSKQHFTEAHMLLQTL
eukprot:4650784-Ditylum_brightwellii.AAC.1